MKRPDCPVFYKIHISAKTIKSIPFRWVFNVTFGNNPSNCLRRIATTWSKADFLSFSLITFDEQVNNTGRWWFRQPNCKLKQDIVWDLFCFNGLQLKLFWGYRGHITGNILLCSPQVRAIYNKRLWAGWIQNGPTTGPDVDSHKAHHSLWFVSEETQ